MTKLSALVPELRRLMEAATPGEWQVVVDRHPHQLGGHHVERRIFTVADDPQLKAPWPVVNISIGLPANKGELARHMVAISQTDADLIVETINTLPALLDALEAKDAALRAITNMIDAPHFNTQRKYKIRDIADKALEDR